MYFDLQITKTHIDNNDYKKPVNNEACPMHKSRILTILPCIYEIRIYILALLLMCTNIACTSKSTQKNQNLSIFLSTHHKQM